MSTAQINNTTITRDDILEILRGYKDLKKHVLQLEYEIADSRPLINNEEVIVSMAIDETPITGRTCRRTGTDDIALSYAQITEDINVRHRKSMEDELCILRKKKERLEYYISLLDSKQSNVLTLIYFEGLTFNEAAEKLFMSTSTLKYIRLCGINKLITMYGNIIESTSSD